MKTVLILLMTVLGCLSGQCQEFASRGATEYPAFIPKMTLRKPVEKLSLSPLTQVTLKQVPPVEDGVSSRLADALMLPVQPLPRLFRSFEYTTDSYGVGNAETHYDRFSWLVPLEKQGRVTSLVPYVRATGPSVRNDIFVGLAVSFTGRKW